MANGTDARTTERDTMSQVLRYYKVRLLPNTIQQQKIEQALVWCDFIYNHYRDKNIKRQAARLPPMSLEDCLSDLTLLRREMSMLQEIESSALRNAVRRLYQAYAGNPDPDPLWLRWHMSYTTSSGRNIRVEENKVFLPFLALIPYKAKNPLRGRPIKATVIREGSQNPYQFYLALTAIEEVEYAKIQSSVGLDLGIKDLCVTSKGERLDTDAYPAFILHLEKKLKRYRRKLSRQKRGSRNYRDTEARIHKTQQKLDDMRQKPFRDLADQIVTAHDLVAVESLNFDRAARLNPSAVRLVKKSGMLQLHRNLKTRAARQGKVFVEVGSYFQSSQICDVCGIPNPEVKDLNVRQWTCPNCQAIHYRDINAAINIVNEGLALAGLPADLSDVF